MLGTALCAARFRSLFCAAALRFASGAELCLWRSAAAALFSSRAKRGHGRCEQPDHGTPARSRQRLHTGGTRVRAATESGNAASIYTWLHGSKNNPARGIDDPDFI
jgi:hypothetical protein